MTTSQIICTSCKLPFTPIVTASGFHFSKLCSGCLTAKEIAKRRELLSRKEVPSIRPKTGKKGRESKSVKPKRRGVNIKELDRVFSIFIRQRDSDKDGIGRCISCGDPIHWKKGDCGHYINRKHMATRFDENNTALQCRSCNRFDEGNLQGFRRGLIAKIGEKETDMLEVKKHNTFHLIQEEINLLTEYYRNKILSL